MKFECIYNDINKALNSVTKVNAKSSTFPILELIHIEAEDNMITFRSTNLELVIESSINAKVEVKGKIVINYSNISKITNLIKSDSLKIELVDNFLYIQSGKSKIKLQVNPYEDIPQVPALNIKQDSMSINKDILVNTIKSVSFAVANTDIKPEISSVYMYSMDSFLYVVATDTFRLAENRISLSNLINTSNNNRENNTDNKNNINSNTDIQNIDSTNISTQNIDINNKLSIMIPGKNVAILLSILDSLSTDIIEMSSYNDGIIINNNNTFIAIRTINGNFPDYKQLFPKEWLGVISLDKTLLSSNLNATVLFKDSYSYSNFVIKGNTLYIKTNNNNIGSYESEMEIKNLPAKEKEEVSNSDFELEAKYNSGLLLEGLSKLEGNKIKIHFTTPNKPIFIKSESNNDFVYVLMPLNR